MKSCVLHRISVMVRTGLYLRDQSRQHPADDWGILELIATCADRHIEPWQVGAVIDGGPVIGNVVSADDPPSSVGHPQARETPCRSGGLGLEYRHGRIRVDVVRIVEPLE